MDTTRVRVVVFVEARWAEILVAFESEADFYSELLSVQVSLIIHSHHLSVLSILPKGHLGLHLGMVEELWNTWFWASVLTATSACLSSCLDLKVNQRSHPFVRTLEANTDLLQGLGSTKEAEQPLVVPTENLKGATCVPILLI